MEPRAYDCVLFNGEFDVLAIRIRELGDSVHRFVLVEANKTFSGLEKPIAFTKDHPVIREFADQIDFVLVDDMPDTENAWDRETWQRNAVMRGLTDAADGDLVLMSDVDEIPRSDCVRAALQDVQSQAFAFRMSLYYFYMNYKNIKGHPNSIWAVGAKMAMLRHQTPDSLRYEIRKGSVLARIFDAGGWHFSYLMDEASVREKIKSFSHQEFNNKGFLQKVDIGRLVTQSDDLFGRAGYEWSIVNDDNLPHYVVEHRAEFRRYFYHGIVRGRTGLRKWARHGREALSYRLKWLWAGVAG